MLLHRFPLALFIAGLLLTQSFGAMAASAPTYDNVAGKKDDTPLPKPKPPRGPREGGGGDEN